MVNSITAGGAERLVQDLHHEYSRMGHQSSIVAIAGDERLLGGDGIWCSGCSSPYEYSATTMLTDLFKADPFSDADAVHVHLFPSILKAPGAIRKEIGRAHV